MYCGPNAPWILETWSACMGSKDPVWFRPTGWVQSSRANAVWKEMYTVGEVKVVPSNSTSLITSGFPVSGMISVLVLPFSVWSEVVATGQ